MDKNDWGILKIFFGFSNIFFEMKMEDYNLRFFSRENKPWVEYLLKLLGIIRIGHAIVFIPGKLEKMAKNDHFNSLSFTCIFNA